MSWFVFFDPPFGEHSTPQVSCRSGAYPQVPWCRVNHCATDCRAAGFERDHVLLCPGREDPGPGLPGATAPRTGRRCCRWDGSTP